MLWTIIALIVLMFFIGLASWIIFLWAAKTRKFDDIERPKHRMMDEDSWNFFASLNQSETSSFFSNPLTDLSICATVFRTDNNLLCLSDSRLHSS